MKKYTVNQLWGFVNRIEVEDPKLTRERAQSAIKFLDNIVGLDVNTYNDMMDAIAYIVRESYHR